jgi:hypothetical protein
MRQVLFKILIVVVAVIMISGAGVSASATEHRSTDSASVDANSELFLTASASETVKTMPDVVVTLRCDPNGGRHPHTTQACTRLRKVDGDFTKLGRSTGITCPAFRASVTVTAQGTWRGRLEIWQRTYSNECELNASTYPIFAF